MLDQLSTYRASDSEVVVQAVQAFGAKGVTTVNENTRNFLSDVELFCAVVAEVEATAFVVGLNGLLLIESCLDLLSLLLRRLSLLLQSLNFVAPGAPRFLEPIFSLS